MTKSTLPLLALILSTALHAASDSFWAEFDCNFGVLSRRKAFAGLPGTNLPTPISRPVSLLQPTGPVRFGMAMVVELKTGQKVTAIANAASATPDMVWRHLQQQYRDQLIRPLWFGAVEIRARKENGAPGKIVQATSMPVELRNYSKTVKTEGDVKDLISALTACQPDLIDSQKVKRSPVWRPNKPQPKWVPFPTNQRAVSEVLRPMQQLMKDALTARDGLPTTAREFLDTLSSKKEALSAYSHEFGKALLGLENDGLISAAKVEDIKSLYSDLLNEEPQPNRFLGDAFHGEISALLDRIQYVMANPRDHVEIIEPGTMIPGPLPAQAPEQ